MNVHRTPTVTRGVSHGPITRSDPNRSDPAHMQLHGSPSTTSSSYVMCEAPIEVVSADAPTAWVTWHEHYPAQQILEALDYCPPQSHRPNGSVLIVGGGRCPLWAGLEQIEVRP